MRRSEVSDLLFIKNMTSLEAKGKKKATEDEALTFDDSEDTGDLGHLSGISSDSDSERDSGSDLDSVSSAGHESGSGTKPGIGANDPPLSREDLLAYLEDMRRRFSTKPTTDSFADQEEVLIVTSKKKLGTTHPWHILRLTYLLEIYLN